MQHLEFVKLPLSFSCLIRPKIDASESQHQHIIEFETAFETGQIKEFGWNYGALFSSSLYCKIFHGCFNPLLGKQRNSSTKASF